jgi:penicillin-binding protein 2
MIARCLPCSWSSSLRRWAFLILAGVLAACTLSGQPATPGATPTLPEALVTSLPAPDAEATVSRFLEAWRAEDHAAMYALLSPLSQDAIDPQDFAQRYLQVKRLAALTGVDYELVSSLVNPRDAQVRYRLILHSAVFGDIIRETWIDLKRNDGEWGLVWTEAAILPELAAGNRLQPNYVSPTRANIYDRNGLAFAARADAVALHIVPNQIGDEDAEAAMLSALSRLLDRRPESIQALYDDIRGTDWFTPLGEVALEDYRRFEGALSSVGGVVANIYNTRYYYGMGLAPHAVGYVAQLQPDDLELYQARGYPVDAYVGKIGVEAVYEAELRGRPGGTLLVLNPEGQVVTSLATVDPEPPKAVYTTLDRDLQRHVQNAIAGFRGAVVVLERDSGRVLALASSPGFDPNLFDPGNRLSGDGLARLFQNPNAPFQDRATASFYPLGSVFKIITMAAGLESDIYQPSTTYTCNGFFEELPGIVLTDWTVDRELPPHGEITLLQGLERSCNPFFWHIGLDLFNQGLTTALPDMARGFGLGQPTEIEIGDASGTVPDPESKLERLGEEWAPRDAVQLAIGQSFLGVTPIQVARFTAAIGNGGTLYQPQIIERIQSAEGEVSDIFAPIVQGQLPLSEETLAAIQQAMVQVIREERGTARRRFLGLSLNLAGKTGTAESGAADPHSWFAGYTFEGRPNRPDIAVVVILEYTGEGSEWAAPVFRRVIESYFFGGPRAIYPWESQIGVLRTETPEPEDGENAEETPAP